MKFSNHVAMALILGSVSIAVSAEKIPLPDTIDSKCLDFFIEGIVETDGYQIAHRESCNGMVDGFVITVNCNTRLYRIVSYGRKSEEQVKMFGNEAQSAENSNSTTPELVKFICD